MLRTSLRPHPDTPPGPINLIRAQAHRKGREGLAFSFRVAGEIGEIRWPGEERSGYEGWQRGDDLWQHTCFEAFGAIEGIPGYYELNFATSGKWAAYRFSDYRKGMQPTDELGLVVARWFIHERQMGFEAVMQVPKEFGDLTWDVGLSAVIEEKSGNKSYWALAHLPGKPDFHHPACFAARLEPPGV